MFRALLVTLLASSPLIAADAKTVEAVKNAERAWAAATVKGDAAALGNLLADDLTYTHSTGDTDTKRQFIANLSGARKYHKIEYESLDARLYLNGTAPRRARLTSACYTSGSIRRTGGSWRPTSRCGCRTEEPGAQS
ncbi:MAG: hypothetical protein DMG07_13645 [Acidobacteria bacterium]|nr:MAG: hypothetical protein DMG07_13645 [Acidobacteriota bacterium]